MSFFTMTSYPAHGGRAVEMKDPPTGDDLSRFRRAALEMRVFDVRMGEAIFFSVRREGK